MTVIWVGKYSKTAVEKILSGSATVRAVKQLKYSLRVLDMGRGPTQKRQQQSATPIGAVAQLGVEAHFVPVKNKIANAIHKSNPRKQSAKATHKKKPADKIELRKSLDFCKQVFCAIRQDGRLWPAHPIVEVKIQ